MTSGLAASIKARLLARAKGQEFELTLVRYAAERWLYRLGASGARERSILKGAALLTFWMAGPYRSTRDVDLYRMPDLERRWRGYLTAGAVLVQPRAQFEIAGERIIHFLGPVRNSIVERASFDSVWDAGGPWMPREEEIRS